MPSYRTDTVAEVVVDRPGLQRVTLRGGDGAYVVTQLTGTVAAGDEVVVNTTAVDLGLGTGGWHVVIWNLSRRAWREAGPGHIMKLRYTPLQVDTGAAEEAAGSLDSDLGGMPVAVGTLHSQLPGILAALHHARPVARAAYVMTDGAALPLALSDLVVALRESGLLDTTITAGQAFGGDLEAVNVPSALALARHRAGADVAIVAMGPGVVGTGTRLGTTALEAAPALDAVAALGGRPVFCARFSSGDRRARHLGLSHHAATVLDLVRSRVEVPVPPHLAASVREVAGGRHRVVEVEAPDPAGLLDGHGLRVTTMGRGPEAEPDFFAVCAAVGVHAAELLGP